MDADVAPGPLRAAAGVRRVYRTGTTEVVALDRLDPGSGSPRSPPASAWAVLGPSGSGKTTSLNCLTGLDDIDAGRVLLGGVALHDLPVAERTRQRASEWGSSSGCSTSSASSSRWRRRAAPQFVGVSPAEARRRAVEARDRVGLSHRVDHRSSELSGGEQLRRTIARALVGHLPLVWADQLTGALDTDTGRIFVDLKVEQAPRGPDDRPCSAQHGLQQREGRPTGGPDAKRIRPSGSR